MNTRASLKVLVALCVLAVGCSENKDALIQVDAVPGLGLPVVAQVMASADNKQGVTRSKPFPTDGTSLKFGLYVPASPPTPTVTVVAWNASGCKVGLGTKQVTVSEGAKVSVTITVSPISELCSDAAVSPTPDAAPPPPDAPLVDAPAGDASKPDASIADTSPPDTAAPDAGKPPDTAPVPDEIACGASAKCTLPGTYCCEAAGGTYSCVRSGQACAGAASTCDGPEDCDTAAARACCTGETTTAGVYASSCAASCAKPKSYRCHKAADCPAGLNFIACCAVESGGPTVCQTTKCAVARPVDP